MAKKLSLLIVDDDADDRKFFIDAVREVDENIECLTAKDGKHALELLREITVLPDVIFLDLRMPRINGKKCLIEIKNDERLKNIHVYVYTTSREVTESEELQKLGAVHFISKPSNHEEIYYIISLLLEEELIGLGKKAIE